MGFRPHLLAAAMALATAITVLPERPRAQASSPLPTAPGDPVDEGEVLDIRRSGDEVLDPVRVERGKVLVRRRTPAGEADFEAVAIGDADPARAAQELATHPDVASAQPSYRMYPRAIANDPLFKRQWNLSQLQMEDAWDLQRGLNEPVIVAILDTGVAYTNATVDYVGYPLGYNGVLFPALGPLTLQFAAAPELGRSSRFVAPWDFIWNTDRPLDLDGHGTHVAGTIGQLTNNHIGPAGIAPDVRLMPLKVLSTTWDDAFASPNIGTDETVARGIRYAVDHGARVLNLSIGRTGPPAPILEDAMRYAVSRGAFIAVAAGNGHEAGDPTEVLAEIASRLDGAVAVGAVTQSRTRAYYSNVGPHVELVAPGGSFRDDGPQGGIVQQTYDLNLVETYSLTSRGFAAPRFDVMASLYFTGTSSAVPHVSGVAAMLMQRGLRDPAAIEALLERSAIDLGPPGRDDEYGYGELDARAALRRAGR